MTREEAKEHLQSILDYYNDRIEHEKDQMFDREQAKEDAEALETAIAALRQEPLTDKEQRIFLAAMSKEEKVCKKVDAEYPDKEPYEDTLLSVCRSIERKVKKTLWK